MIIDFEIKIKLIIKVKFSVFIYLLFFKEISFDNGSQGMGEYERGSFRYGDSQPTTTTSIR